MFTVEQRDALRARMLELAEEDEHVADVPNADVVAKRLAELHSRG